MEKILSVFCVLFAFATVCHGRSSVESIIRSEGMTLLKDVENTKLGVDNSGCDCVHVKYDCGCCAHLDIKEIKLDNTVCVNVTYLPDQYGISVLMTWDGKTILNMTVSAKNPPPLCLGIPHVKLLDVCVKFYDLDVINKKFHGCVKLEADVAYVEVEDVSLGCFNIPVAERHSAGNSSDADLMQHLQRVQELIDVINNSTQRHDVTPDVINSNTGRQGGNTDVINTDGSDVITNSEGGNEVKGDVIKINDVKRNYGNGGKFNVL